MLYEHLPKVDAEIFNLIKKERDRQTYGLELIASENFTSKAVLEAMGSVLTNKYAEGYPYKREKDGTKNMEKTGRYYGGNQFVDQVENIANERCKELFGVDHTNVQPNAGSPANLAAYYAFCDVGDTVMGMSLAHGGHLTHGHGVSFSGTYYKSVQYPVDEESQYIDFDFLSKMAREHQPRMIIFGATAYPREYDFKAAREVADEVGAYLMADIAHIAGLVVGGVHQSPVPYADVVTSTTHKTLRGPRSGLIMCRSEYEVQVDKAVFPGLQGGPLEHIIAAKAVCFKEAMKPEFKDYAKQIVKNARVMAEELMSLGLTLVTGGTDNHLILADVTPIGLTGIKAEKRLEKVNITVNKNMIPFDKRSAWSPSGIRLGTPALTTRGMKESEMKEIARLIGETLTGPPYKQDRQRYERIKSEVIELCRGFIFYD